MAAYRWKSFSEDEDRPEKPRRYGVTEIRGPNYSLFSQNALQGASYDKAETTSNRKKLIENVSERKQLCKKIIDRARMGHAQVSVQECHSYFLQDLFESMGQFVDGLKFSGGSSLMPQSYVKKVTDMARRHDIYVSTGDWGEQWLRKGPSAVKAYIEECKRLGFDTIELDVGSLEIPEETLLRYVHMIKSGGLKVKPQFALKFDKTDLPVFGDRAFGAYVVPRARSYDFVEDVDLLVRRAERCLEAGADMIMIDAEDICRHAESVRADVIAKIISRLGVEKTMFEADGKTSEWFITQYGPKVNLFVDHSQVLDLECTRGRGASKNHMSVLGSSYLLV